MKITKPKETILLLALGDDFWTPFVFDMAEDLIRKGIDVIVATDTRAGEYQVFGGRKNAPWKTYYFSDYIKTHELQKINQSGSGVVEIDAMFSDYYRLFVYGAYRHLSQTHWVKLKSLMESFFEEIIEKENIGVVLHDQVSTSFSYVCFIVAKARGVDYLGLVGARIPERYEVRTTIKEEDRAVEAIYQEIVSGEFPLTDEERSWARNFLGNIDNQEPSYMKGNFLNDARFFAYANKGKFASFLRKVKYEIAEHSENSYYSFREPPIRTSLRSFKRNMLRLIRKKEFAAFDSNIGVEWIESHKYWLYPIHFQPEASTSVGSPHFVDQLDLIRNIAFSLPNDTYLVVKEHQSAIGFHNQNFYRNLASLPKVRLVGPQWNIKQLIRKSLGVVTLTSTAAFEALLLRKQVYMFGDAFYQFHPHCKKIGSWGELKVGFRTEQENHAQYSAEEFLVAYRRYTRPGTLTYAKHGWGISEDLISLLEKTLNERAKRR